MPGALCLFGGAEHIAAVAIEQNRIAALQRCERADRVKRAGQFDEELLASVESAIEGRVEALAQ